ncbi:ribonuclease H-like domain-containing protein [Tanacetum coccineum]|uniref:Ribonuclease H-like domain-containing protein n=1 Tax=Tanacetum coccineum TaxID=301880 RepID=A0ABQ5IS28_9ASTR
MMPSTSQEEIPPPPPPPPSSQTPAQPTPHTVSTIKLPILKKGDMLSGFGGNDESKKMQKYILKQQFEGFSVSNTEGLHKGYDRFQSLLSQLEIHGAGVSNEDANQKFLDSTFATLSQVSLIMRTKPGVDTLSFDDLYNNLRVFESDIKGSTASSSSSPQNVAFVSENTNSTNEEEGCMEFGNKEGSRYWTTGGSKALVTVDGEECFMNKDSDLENHLDDRFAEGLLLYPHHDVPPPMTGNYMPSGPDIEVDYSQFTYGPKQTQPSESESQTSEFDTCESNISTEPSKLVFEPVVNESNVECQPNVWTDAPIIEEYESDSEDEYVSIPTKEQETPSFANQQVKTPRETVKNQCTHSQKPKAEKKELGYGFTARACFVCGSLNHLIRDCDFHEKRMARQAELNKGLNRNSGQWEIRLIWNNVQRVNKQNRFVSTAVLTRTGKILVNTARPSSTNKVSTARQNSSQAVLTSTAMKVNTVKPIVNRVRPANVFHKTHSPSSRPFKKTTVLRSDFSKQKVNTAKDYPHRALKNKGIVDSGCSRHMTGNKAYLAEFQDFNGGPVAFGGSKGYITGKGKIKTGKLDFEDVCFVKELQHFNLFSVSQMCDKKNKVLFTDSECLVLSPEFKLPDENQVLLKIPRQNNMYSFNLENIVPSGGLACLIAKATTDESNKWHRRLGHVNFKNLNKLVKGNLVRGLPSKIFQNDHTCVACQKGKQHKASCKAKSVSSISHSLQLLHMDLFGPTSVRSLNHKTYCLVITDDFSRVSSFDLETYSIVDYAGANLGQEIHNRRVSISWAVDSFLANAKSNHCATSSYRAEYIAAGKLLLANKMAVLDSCPKHNMVAYLEKSEGNVEFHEIIDFLKRSSIHHALTARIYCQIAGKTVTISEGTKEVNLLFFSMIADEGAFRKTICSTTLHHTPAPTSEDPMSHRTDSSPAKLVRNFCENLGRDSDQQANMAEKWSHWKQRFPSQVFSKKHRVHKESVSKQGRKFAKGESSVQRDPLFDEVPEDTVDHMETENAQNEGRTKEMVDEDKEIDERILSTEDILCADKEGVSTDMEKVSTDKPIVITDGSKVSTDRQFESTDGQNEGTEENFEGTEEHIGAKAVSKEKEKGVELKDIEEVDRPKPTSTRSLLTLKPLPKIDPKDKGKKKIEEDDESESESNGIPKAEKNKAAQRKFLAQQRSEAIRNRPPTKNQLRNQMMTYLKHVGNFKHADLKTKKFEEIQALYEKKKRSDEDFIAIGTAEEARLIKKIILDIEIMGKKSVIARLNKVSSPDGDYLVIYRANGNFRAFNYLIEVRLKDYDVNSSTKLTNKVTSGVVNKKEDLSHGGCMDHLESATRV